jgi:hypothetical protein
VSKISCNVRKGFCVSMILAFYFDLNAAPTRSVFVQS